MSLRRSWARLCAALLCSRPRAAVFAGRGRADPARADRGPVRAPSANAGEAVHRNLLWAVERVNRAAASRCRGGARPLALVRFDSKGQTEEALAPAARGDWTATSASSCRATARRWPRR